MQRKISSLLIFSLFIFLVFTPDHTFSEIKGESIWSETDDGRQIHIFFIRGQGEVKAKFPVILCHGLGAQGKYWYFNEKSSWAPEIAKNGFDVFVPDLRGVGKSGGKMDFNFYDYSKDVIAIIDKVKKITGAEKVHWVGHSMGGMVIYLTLTEKPEFVKENLASLTIISSPYKIWQPFEINKILQKNFDAVSQALKKIDSIPFSFFAGFYRFAFPFFQIAEDISPIAKSFQYFVWNLDLVDIETRKDVILGTANVSSKVLEKFLRVGLGYEDFGFEIENLQVPSIFIVGTNDFLATPPTVKLAYIKAGTKDKKFFLAGVGEGFSGDYGHVDINTTNISKSEILPIVIAHLTENDTKEKIEQRGKTQKKIEEEKKEEDNPKHQIQENFITIIKSHKKESAYSFLLIQDFGLKSDIWEDFIENIEEKSMSYYIPNEVKSIESILKVTDIFCKSGTSSYNIGVLHGFSGTALLKIKSTCFDAIFLLSSPIKEISKYYRMYLETGGRISSTVIKNIFGEDLNIIEFSPLKHIISDIMTADFLIEERQKIFLILSTGTRTQYWWDVGEIPYNFRSYSKLLLSPVNFAENLSHIEIIKGKKAKRYVIPYIMNHIANLKK